MKKLKNLFKTLSIGLINWMIVFTFLLSPLSSNLQVVYAAEDSKSDKDKKDDDCKEEERNDEGQPGVYKPGCKFDDALTKVNEKPGGKGIKGMVEQFVGIAFASAAVSSLIFKNTPRSLADCPQNKNANITLRLMQAGSLAYLLGEMKAKAEFKKASKLATDATFTPKQKLAENAGDDAVNERNREENNKQLEAYETLIKVYEHKVKGIGAKKKLAMVAELAYLGALGTELVMTMGHKGQCKATFVANRSSQATNIGALQALLAPVGAAATPPSPTATVCTTALVGVNEILAVETTSAAREQTASATLLATGEAQGAIVIADATTVLTGVGSVISAPVPTEGLAIAAEVPPLESAVAADTAIAAAAEATRAAEATAQQATWSAGLSQCSACPTCIRTLVTLATTETASESAPIMCCGADVSITTNGYINIPNAPGVMDSKIDIAIKKIPIIGSNQIEFIKPAILNTIEQFYYSKLMEEIDYKHPEITLSKLSSFYTYLNQLEKNFDNEIENSHEFKLYKKELAGEFDESMTVASLEKIKLSLIQDAHAINFMSILGFGAKLFVMNKLLGGFLRNKGLPRPKSRMYTFGAMGAVNAAIILFEGKKLSENKKYLEIVKAEKERFEKSHAMQTGLIAKTGSESAEGMIKIGEGEGEGEGTDYLRLTRNQGLMACAIPAAGKSFAPAPCPQKLPDSFLGDLKSKSVSGNAQVTPLLQQIPGLVATTTAGAASGDDLNNPAVFGANLTALENKRAALKGQVDKLVKDYDEMNKPNKNDKSKRAETLARTLANIQSTFKGTPIGGASAPSLGDLSDSNGVQEVEEESSKQDSTLGSGGKIANVPNFQSPSFGGGSPAFDYGDSDNFGNSADQNSIGKAQSLDEFVVNTGEVVDKPEANIFNLISNRYIKSYPILLEEITPRPTADK